jgi:hypothetical protein
MTKFFFYVTGVIRAKDTATAKIFLHEALLDSERTQLPMPLNMRPIELLEVDVREFSQEERVVEEEERKREGGGMGMGGGCNNKKNENQV